MTRRLVVAMVGLAALVAIALAVPMAIGVAASQRAGFVSGLEVDTLSTALTLSSTSDQTWQATANATADRTGARVVVVGPDRSLIADSDHSGADRSFERPEINAALAGRLTSDVRESATLGDELRFVAAPVVRDGGVIAAVRLSLPDSEVDDAVRRTVVWLGIFVVGVVIAAGLVAWLIAQSIANPLRRVSDVATRLPDDLTLRCDERRGPREVRSVAQALNSTARRLAGILEHTSRVAVDASHHLRTPLTGVRLRLEAIEDLTTDPVVRAEAQSATGEVDRLSRRIDQVLTLARVDSGSATAEVQDVSGIVRASLDGVEPIARRRGVIVVRDVRPGVGVVAPAGLVSRIVDELVANALDYATARITVTLSREDETGILRVEDDGPGVPPSEREVIFERFRRGSMAKPGGSGLGLALVGEAAASLGGMAAAGAASPDGTGMRVEVRFPATEPPEG